MSQLAPADTDEHQAQHQCRICLDGPDPDLGRLIRPCLCSGTVSVGQAFPPLSRTRTHTQPSLSFPSFSNSTYTSPVSSGGGTPLPMRRPSSSVRSVATIIALLAQRSSASRPTQVRPVPTQSKHPLSVNSAEHFRSLLQSRSPLYLQSFSR
jgi:hypothetical protein